ncbi:MULTISPECIES: polysaccharide biosynthesis/export family protein [unclassified Novosphingobium]|uniref:SLBB domain-containing protein n=1 Tax=unclassified Novosphingobium TaxID=2644732 RepID=UPI0007812B8E|nr:MULTISPECIES: polysaccharide biosynthesis/export family protein [unclassified Novosphingobium]QOV96227.1 SLBB domain-containing protein [Novosphingobium sp. ES2-1]
MDHKKLIASALGTVLLIAGSAVAQVAPPASGSTPASTLNQGYLLGPGDVIEVSVLGQAEFTTRQPVQADGTVTLQYIHAVKASGLSVLQFRDQVARLLKQGGFYNDPVVIVGVAQYASRYVTVLGEFGTPGILPVDRPYRVSEIIARAGGVRATAGDTVIVRRSNGDELSLSISAVASGGPLEDPYVSPDDKLFIATAANFYVSGQVGAPGVYKLEKNMTYRMALARAGGVTDRGSMGKVSVYRNGKKVKVDLDAPVAADDSIFIGERFF